MTKKKAVVILSGGMDSVTTLAIANDKNFDCYNLTFDYGQKSISEISSATYYSDKFESIEHKIFNINLQSILINHQIGQINHKSILINHKIGQINRK